MDEDPAGDAGDSTLGDGVGPGGAVRRQQAALAAREILSRVFRHNVRNKLNVAQGHAELLCQEANGGVTAHTEAILDTTGRLVALSEKARLIETVVDSDDRHTVDLTRTVEDSLKEIRETCALDTFERVDTPRDELHTLASLVDICHDQGNDQRTREWCRQARATLDEAPDSVARRHREWVTTAASELRLD